MFILIPKLLSFQTDARRDSAFCERISRWSTDECAPNDPASDGHARGRSESLRSECTKRSRSVCLQKAPLHVEKMFLGTNPCADNNGGCQELCLFAGAEKGVVCKCSFSQLASDGKACIRKFCCCNQSKCGGGGGAGNQPGGPKKIFHFGITGCPFTPLGQPLGI